MAFSWANLRAVAAPVLAQLMIMKSISVELLATGETRLREACAVPLLPFPAHSPRSPRLRAEAALALGCTACSILRPGSRKDVQRLPGETAAPPRSPNRAGIGMGTTRLQKHDPFHQAAVGLHLALLFYLQIFFLYTYIYICTHKLQKQHTYAGVNAVSEQKRRQLCV